MDFVCNAIDGVSCGSSFSPRVLVDNQFLIAMRLLKNL